MWVCSHPRKVPFLKCECAHTHDVRHVKFPLWNMGVLTPMTYGQVWYTFRVYLPFNLSNKNISILVNAGEYPHLRKSWSFMDVIWKLSEIWRCTWTYEWFLNHDTRWWFFYMPLWCHSWQPSLCSGAMSIRLFLSRRVCVCVCVWEGRGLLLLLLLLFFFLIAC